MGDKTGISWTDATWAPVKGCSRISEGCRNCYAEKIAARFSKPGQAFHGFAQVVAPRDLLDRTGGRRNGWTRKVEFQPDKLAIPLRWRKPKRIFCSSMTDVLHEDVTNEQIAAIFGVMAACPQHTFQVLTKRAKRMREWFEWLDEQEQKAAREGHARTWDFRAYFCWGYARNLLRDAGISIDSSVWNAEMMERAHLITWPLPNVWLGVSVENQDAADERIPQLLRTPAAMRFLSCEPLIGPLDVSCWLGGQDVGQDQEGGGIRLRGSESGRDGDRSERSNLAHCETTRIEDGRNNIESVQTTPGRTTPWRLPERESDGRREANDSARSSDRLVPCERLNPRHPDDQPQERKEDGQSSDQSRTRDRFGADAPCDTRPAQRACGEPERDEESRYEADDRAGRGDSPRTNERRKACNDRNAVRGDVSTHFGSGARSKSIGWIISGCESGPGARPCSVEWLRSLRDQCDAADIAFFLKQATQPGSEAVGGPLITPGNGSKRKAGGVIELPYLDGVQHANFPTVTP